MKPNRLLLLSAALAFRLSGAPLAQTTAVQTQPDPEAPVIGILNAGTEPVPAPEGMAETPPGWMAVSAPGPFTGYVRNQDLTKGLDVRPGASVYLQPNPGAPVLTVAVRGDKIALTGLRGKWMQVRVDRNISGYIHLGPLPPAPAGPAGPPAGPPPVDLSTSSGPGHPAPDGAAAESPRFFEGKFVSTRRPFHPRRPYPWELDASDGSRLAYLDLGRLLLTEQVDSYLDHEVQVFGTPKRVPGTMDIVLVVESLRLK